MRLLVAFGNGIGRRRLLALGPAGDVANRNAPPQAARQRLPCRMVTGLEPSTLQGKLQRFLLPPEELTAIIDGLAGDREWSGAAGGDFREVSADSSPDHLQRSRSSATSAAR
jgi:hypothetical protein